MLRKVITLALALLLMGQNMAFAQSRQPKTLKEYQNRTKQELNAASNQSWLRNSAVYLIGVGGTITGILGIIAYHMKKELVALNKNNKLLAAEIENAKSIKKEVLDLEREVTKLNQEIKELKLNNKINKGKLEASQRKLTKARADLQEANRELANSQKIVEKYEGLVSKLKHKESLLRQMLLLPEIPNIDKYLKLFENGLSKTTQQSLLAQLKKEPWLQKLPAEEQKALLKQITDISNMAAAPSKYEVSSFIGILVTTGSKESYAAYLKSFAYSLMKAKNFFTVSAIIGLSCFSASEAKAQQDLTRASRIQSNFNLFINASDNQLAQMEKSTFQRQASIDGAEVVHMLNRLGKEQTILLTQIITEEVAEKRIKNKLKGVGRSQKAR